MKILHASILLATTALASHLAFAAPARAQSSEATLNILQEQVKALQEQIDALKKQQEEANASEIKIENKGAPQISGPGFKFKIRGRLQTDFGIVGDPDKIGTVAGGVFSPDSGLGTTSEVRRARLGVEGAVSDWTYKFEADFADNDVSIADAIIGYSGFDGVDLAVGNQKTGVSLEEQTSSRFTKFMERAAFTDAFAFERELGATATFGGKNWHWIAGVFSSGGFSGDDEAKGYILASRAHYTMPIENGFVHIGGSIEYRDEDAQQERFRQRPQLHTSDTRFVDTGNLGTDSSVFFGGELAAVFGPLNAAAEYAGLSASFAEPSARGTNNAYFQGGYVQLGYFLTGERRGYKTNSGAWDRTKPLKPLDKGGMGAWELNVGVDWIDLEDRNSDAFGGKQVTYNAGMTWIPISYVRVIAQYGKVDVSNSRTHVVLKNDGGFSNDFNVNTFGLRAQLDW